MNIDKYFTKVYNEDSYNCAHFVCEFWQELTGEDITHKLLPLLSSKDKRTAKGMHGNSLFTKHKNPVDPCIVVAKRKGNGTHVGVYHNGKIIHITKTRTEFVKPRIFMLMFDVARYYR